MKCDKLKMLQRKEKKMIEIKRAALYARFSSDNQRTESIDAQVRAMKDFCTQNKWKIVETYVDEAYSATNDRRPSFQRMIEDSGKGMFDIVLVHKLDRFSRNRYDSAIYKNKLKHNGVRLYSVLERLDDSPESIILESMLESIGEYYSSNIAREVMKGLKENAFHCKHTGGSAPLGYDVGEDKKLVINEREAEAVRIIYDMYINGYGYRNIAEYLNSKGYVTKKGNNFKPNSVSFYEILNNLKYTGTYVYNRSSSKNYSHRRNSHRYKPEEEIIKITGGCPAIISTETFQKAAERRKSVTAKGQLGSKHFYLCSGIVVCGECGKKMFGRKRFGKYTFNVYCCTSYKADCCNIKEVDSARLDEHTVKLLEREMFNELAMKKRIAGLNKRIERYNCRIPAMRKSLNRELDKINTELIKLHSKKEKSIETYEKINTLELRKNDLEYAIDNLHETESVSYSDYSNLINRFYELKEDNLRFRTFVQDYITSITVYRDKVVFCLNYGLGILDDVTKKYTFERKLFKTPTQKM